MPSKLLPHLRHFNYPLKSACFPLLSMNTWISNSFGTRSTNPSDLTRSSFGPPRGALRVSSRAFRSRGGGFEGRSSTKSLIEDEADLSDWVGDLRTSSLRSGQATSDEENESRGRKPGFRKQRFEVRGRENGRPRSFGQRESFESHGMRNDRKSSFEGSESFEGSGRENDKRASYSRKESFESRGRENGRKGSERPSFFSKRNDDTPNSRGNGSMRKSRGGGVSMRQRDDFRTSPEKQFRSSRNDGRGGFNKFDDRPRRRMVANISDDDDEEVEDDVEFDKLESDLGKFLRESESESESATDGTEEQEDESHVKPAETTVESGSYLGTKKFEDCAISPLSQKALKFVGYDTMTIVQEATLPAILKGKDVLAKAKTGTGKTVAFLLPSIEVVAKTRPVGSDEKRPPIVVLVVCPTRELATQAAAEATTLLKYHTFIGVQVVIGGTRLALEQKKMQANPCQILVATPGRLRDHIANTPGFATRLMGVKVLVLDEADHLLDMGFRKDIENIIAAVPKQRQTLLFSATIPDEVRHICHLALKRDHEFINTVLEGSEETHAQVRQTYVVVPMEKQFPVLYKLLGDHVADNVDYKVLVFCTTAKVTSLVAGMLSEMQMNIREIHSRKPQSYRTRVSEEFRKSKGLILVTSDVSARGVDYPDVTLVVQVGLPADREQYIHRLGRTGRKGKEGQGVLILAPWEEFFLSSVKDLPISKNLLPAVDPDIKRKVEKALSHVEMKDKESAYQAWLGYYNSNKVVGKDKYKLVELANEFSRSMGIDNPPALPKLVLSKMGLRNIPGLRSK